MFTVDIMTAKADAEYLRLPSDNLFLMTTLLLPSFTPEELKYRMVVTCPKSGQQK